MPQAALLLTPKKSFAEVLSSMPDVGEDEDFERRRTHTKQIMYLIDTNVISEARKRAKANRGVRRTAGGSSRSAPRFFSPVITVGELRRGVREICSAIVAIVAKRSGWRSG